MFYSLLLVSLFLHGYNSKSIFAGKSQEHAQRYINKLKTLNKLQAQIFGIQLPDNISEINSSSHAFDNMQWNKDENAFLFEGDIIYTEEQLDFILSEVREQWARKFSVNTTLNQFPKDRSMISDLTARWTMPIPYFIDTEVDVQAVLSGIEKWEQETCIRFDRKDTVPDGNSLKFIYGNGCYSYVGKVNLFPQDVSIGPRCNGTSVVCHEIGHALGLIHEHERYDRDDYIIINSENIDANFISAFHKVSYLGTDDYGVGYDYGSLMHYGEMAFSNNKKETIVARDPVYQTTMGQGIGLSFADIKRVNFAYCNSSCSDTLQCNYGGYVDPNDCTKCKCPEGFGGQLCDVMGPANKGCGLPNLNAASDMQTLSDSGDKICNYVITAPAEKKVYFEITGDGFLRIPPSVTCGYCYIEIRYGEDLTKSGPHFCGTSDPVVSLSVTNQLMVIYKGLPECWFSLDYRFE